MTLEDYYDLDELNADNLRTKEEKEHFSLFHIYEATYLGESITYKQWVTAFNICNMADYLISIDSDPDNINYEYVVTIWDRTDPGVVLGRIGYNVNPRTMWDLHDGAEF